jgi:hypothetical protein
MHLIELGKCFEPGNISFWWTLCGELKRHDMLPPPTRKSKADRGVAREMFDRRK